MLVLLLSLTASSGDMVTFWVRPNAPLDDSFTGYDATATDSVEFSGAFLLRSQADCLVDSIVTIFTKHLQQITAYRESFSSSPSTRNLNRRLPSKTIVASSTSSWIDVSACNEATAIVSLPEYDAHRIRAMKSKAADVELSPLVVQQLRSFIESVATLYRSNPFHNFEVGFRTASNAMQALIS